MRATIAFGGYYACDDCCHMGTNKNEHEYRGIEKIRQAIYDIDPYHLFIGSTTWYACFSPAYGCVWI